jgi:DHA2 family multidrug resistance protein
VNPYLAEAQAGLLRLGGDPAAAHQIALQSLDNLRLQQSSALAYFDTFVFFAAVAVVLTFFVLLMKRSVAEKGAHVAAE